MACRDWKRTVWQPSFKGVTFEVDEDVKHGGRRIVIHEYPSREFWDDEDLGRNSQGASIRGYVYGDNSHEHAESLFAACSAYGPGWLVLPLRPPGMANCLSVHSTFASDSMGRINFDMDFSYVAPAPGGFISATMLAGAVEIAVRDAVGLIDASFGSKLDTALRTVQTLSIKSIARDAAAQTIRYAASAFDKARKRLRSTNAQAIANLEFVGRDMDSRANELAYVGKGYSRSDATGFSNDDDPVESEFPHALEAALDQIMALQGDAVDTASALSELTSFAPDVIQDFKFRDCQSVLAENTAVNETVAIVRRLALLYWARALSLVKFTSRDAALQKRSEVTERFNAELLTVDDAVIEDALRAVYISTVAYLSQSTIDLPSTVIVSLDRQLPAATIATWLYNDAKRDAELVERNSVDHPLYMPLSVEAVAPAGLPLSGKALADMLALARDVSSGPFVEPRKPVYIRHTKRCSIKCSSVVELIIPGTVHITGNNISVTAHTTVSLSDKIVSRRNTLAIPAHTNVQVTTTVPQPFGIDGEWDMVFSDDFNGTSLDLTKWRPNWNGANDTAITAPSDTTQDAAFDPAQVTVANGVCRLSLVADPITIGAKTYPYKGGMIQTNNDYHFVPDSVGYIEARVYLPASSGSALANYPSIATFGQTYPTNGNIALLFLALSANAVGKFNYPGGGPATATITADKIGWHIWGVRWTLADKLEFFLDGVSYGTLTPRGSGYALALSSLQYLALSYGVWTGHGETVVPSYMDVDYVRVWKKSYVPSAAPISASASVAPASKSIAKKISIISSTASLIVTTPGVIPTGISGTWNLVFEDTFTGTSIDLTKWRPNWAGGTNTQITPPVNSAENCAYDPAMVTVANGLLKLSVTTGPVTAYTGTVYPYRGGCVQTNPHYRFVPTTTAAFEARIQFPVYSGTTLANWSGWWTDGQSWPTNGEIDVVETLRPGGVQYNGPHFHYPGGGPGGSTAPGSDNTGWHVWGCKWTLADKLEFYYDGTKYCEIVPRGTGYALALSSLQYLILNQGTSATAGGPTKSPADMYVDYVRVWMAA